MTIPVSAVPSAVAAVISQLNTQLAADSNVGAIGVFQGTPPTTDIPNEGYVIAQAVRRNVAWETFIGSAAQFALDEKFDIECLVSVWDGDNDVSTLYARAYVLLGYLETAVRTDPSLGGNVNIAYPMATTDTTHFVESGGCTVEITCPIHAEVLN